MASTTKEDSKKSKAKPRRSLVKASQPKQAQNIQSLRRNLDESLEREAATSDILRMIARSPTDVQIVLDAIAERAARLCDAEDAAIFRVDGNFLRLAAHFGPIPTADAVGAGRVLDRGTPVVERSLIDRRYMSTIFKPPTLNSRMRRPVESQWASVQCSTHRYSAKALPLVRSSSYS